MPDHMTTIGDVAEVYDGPHATPKKIEQGPYFLSILSLERGTLDLTKSAHLSEEDFFKWTKRVIPRKGDVLFSYETRLGDAALMPPNIKACMGRRMGLLRPKTEKVISEYLLYAYLSPVFQETIRSKTIHGATVDRIALKELPDFPIRVPPTDEQEQVVNVLKSIDLKLELNRQINQTLEEMAQAIFKSWFVDFEPVKAKIEAKANGQDPERAAMCAISGAVQGCTNVAGARTAGATKTEADLDQIPPDQLAQLRTTVALFPDELTDSELGEIPQGWEVKEIKEWGAVICGKTPPKRDASNYGGDVPFIKIPDMHGNEFATTTNDTLSQKGASTQSKKQVPKGSICVSCIATVGQVVIASEDSHTNQQINSIVPGKMSHNYYLFFSMRERTSLLHDLASGGSATLNLNTGNFSKIPLLFPGDPLLNEYFLNVDSSFRSILLNDRQSQVLRNVRDTLLPKLLSGEIELSANPISS